MEQQANPTKAPQAPEQAAAAEAAKKAAAAEAALRAEVAKLSTMSAKIRFLAGEKRMERGAIAKFLNIRYQWVRNVLITPVRKPKA